MNVKELFTDDDAVSPVIGVILMVAITVILAAVIGAFVLNIGGSQENAPQATIDFTNTSDAVKISHQSGDPIPASEVKVKKGGTDQGWPTDYDEMTAGDTVWAHSDNDSLLENKPSDHGISSGTEIQLVWNSPSSDDSSVIASYTTS
jgi:flagellin-like protein